jgi:hypothetical protein
MVSNGIVAVVEFFPPTPLAGGTFESEPTPICYILNIMILLVSTRKMAIRFEVGHMHACFLSFWLIFSIQLIG